MLHSSKITYIESNVSFSLLEWINFSSKVKQSKSCIANTCRYSTLHCLYRVFAVLCTKPGGEIPSNFRKIKLQRRDFCSVKKLKFHRMFFPPSLGTPSSLCASWTSTATSPPSSSWRPSPGGPWTSTTQSTGSTRRAAGWVKTQWKLLATKSAEKNHLKKIALLNS